MCKESKYYWVSKQWMKECYLYRNISANTYKESEVVRISPFCNAVNLDPGMDNQ